jgi:hypothetical protein
MAARPHTRPGASTVNAAPLVLQSFPAAHLEIVLVPCETHDCAIQVRLLEDGHAADRLDLPVTAHLLRPRPEAVDEPWGADAGLTAYRTGFESDYVATTGRVITLAPGVTGLLVTQRHNFEPMKHEHVLVLARKGKLHIVWQAEQGESTWSATQVIRGLAPGSQDVAYLQVSPDPEGMADHFEATRLRWDAATAKLLPTPLPDDKVSLYVLSLGRYETTAKAREVRSNFSFCLPSYWVLDGTAFPAHAPALVGRVFVRRTSAEMAAEQVRSCLTDQKPVIVPWDGPPAVLPPPPPQPGPPKPAAPKRKSPPPAASVPAQAARSY